MRDFLLEFNKRRSEVRRYMAVLLLAERRLGSGVHRNHEEEMKIFRAGALLIIYNAVEASARLGILAIYDEISRTGTNFDELKEKFRIRILNDFKNNVGPTKYGTLRSVAIDLIDSSLDPQRLFSGNVDAKKIREAGETYGFDTACDYAETKNGADLLTVKTRRQDLAHGTLSFSEVGKEYTTEDVIRIARYSLAYMGAVLGHIDAYLDLEGYREPRRPSPPAEQKPASVTRQFLQHVGESLFRLLRPA